MNWLWRICAAGALIFSFLPEAKAQWTATNTPSEGTFEINHVDGTSIIFDAIQQMGIYEDASGNVQTFTFAQMAAAHSPYPIQQAEYVQSLTNSILEPTNIVTFTSATVPTLTLPGQFPSAGTGGNEPPGDVWEIHQIAMPLDGSYSTASMTGLPGEPGSGSNMGCPAPPLPCNCLFTNCNYFRSTAGEFFYGLDSSAPSAGVPNIGQQCAADERNAFNEARADACVNSGLSYAATIFGGALSAITCAAAVGTVGGGGLTAAGCFASVGLATVSAISTYYNYRRCTASWPGPSALCRAHGAL